jgi:hypothetical protein
LFHVGYSFLFADLLDTFLLLEFLPKEIISTPFLLIRKQN